MARKQRTLPQPTAGAAQESKNTPAPDTPAPLHPGDAAGIGPYPAESDAPLGVFFSAYTPKSLPKIPGVPNLTFQAELADHDPLDIAHEALRLLTVACGRTGWRIHSIRRVRDDGGFDCIRIRVQALPAIIKKLSLRDIRFRKLPPQTHYDD